MDSVYSAHDADGKRPPRKPVWQRVQEAPSVARGWWAAQRWSLPGLIAGVLVVAAGGAYWATHLHGSSRPVVGKPVASSHRRHTGTSQKLLPVAAPTASPIAMPVGGRLEAPFGWVYSSYLGEWYYNPGITVAVPAGTVVRAAWGGSVAQVGSEPHVGLTVTVDDGDGYATVYGHLASSALKPGDPVSQGEAVGTVGGPSLYSRQTGAHLDFTVLHGGEPVNPESLIKGSS